MTHDKPRPDKRDRNVSRRTFLGSAAAAAAFSVMPHTARGRNAVPDGKDYSDLAGRWRFKLDPEDEGVDGRWFATALPDRVRLPGSLQEQGFGNDVTLDTDWLASGFGKGMWYEHPMYEPYRQPGHIRVPFVLQPKKHYVGPAWYQRDITIPSGWDGKRITLYLERCHWHTTVWVDERKVGSNDSLATAHDYDLTDHLAPGAHRLTVRVDNSMTVNVGINAHSVSDQTQTAWNGIVGRLGLEASDPVWIDDVQVYPDVASGTARVKILLGNVMGKTARGSLSLKAESHNTEKSHRVGPKEVNFAARDRAYEMSVELDMGDDALLWDEFDPALYRLSVQMQANASGSSYTDSVQTTFGMRKFSTDGTQFQINGRPVFLRGNLECCIFPLTGYPAMNVEGWRRIMRRAKDYGLNHLRFHSWCPPEACFKAADEFGIYLQPEVNEWTHVNSEEEHDFFRRESRRMLRQYGNHPSFTMMALGNEGYCEPEIMKDLLDRWRQDPRRVYTGKCNSNGSVVDQYQYCVVNSWKGEHARHLLSRLREAPASDFDFAPAVSKYPKPLVAHETVQRCSYPDPAWQEKYTGVLSAGYLDIAKGQLEKRRMLDQVPDFVRASGKWQVKQFKEEVEADLRTKGMGGFQLLQLHDFPGQGSALVGVLDAFWDSKGYVDGETFRRFCSPTVPLARMEKLTWNSAETLVADIEISHFGPEPLSDVTVTCQIIDSDGEEIGNTKFGPRDIPIANGTRLGRIEQSLEDFDAPGRYSLVVKIPGAETSNEWGFWVYPGQIHVTEPDDIVIARSPEEAVAPLERGQRVLLLPAANALRGQFSDPFRSIFWTSFNLTRAFGPDGGHTLGILCDPEHPVFSKFPTDPHCDWQWYELLRESHPMILDGWDVEHPWPKDYRPTIQSIDCWKYNRKLALLAEARVGEGRLAICSMDIETDLEERIVARQFRHSLMNYLKSDRFEPQERVNMDQIRALFRELSPLQKLGATASADSYQRGHPANNAIDNHPDTIWHTRWSPAKDPMPHHLTVDLKESRQVLGLRYLPRQDMANGRIARYEIHVSRNGKNWGDSLASGRWPNKPAERKVKFTQPVEARFVRLTALSEVNGNPFASAAEVAPLLSKSEDKGN